MPVATLTAEFDQLLQFGPASFTYYLRIREDAATLHQLLAGLDADRFILITDKKAPPRQVARMHSRLAGRGLLVRDQDEPVGVQAGQQLVQRCRVFPYPQVVGEAGRPELDEPVELGRQRRDWHAGCLFSVMESHTTSVRHHP